MTFTNQRLSEYVYNPNQLYGWCMAIGITKEQRANSDYVTLPSSWTVQDP